MAVSPPVTTYPHWPSTGSFSRKLLKSQHVISNRAVKFS